MDDGLLILVVKEVIVVFIFLEELCLEIEKYLYIERCKDDIE